jgi:hypothetical protein
MLCSCDQDERYPLSIRQMTACIYYKLAIERGLRGCDPEGEFRAHGMCGLTEAQMKLPDYTSKPRGIPECFMLCRSR